MADYLDRLAADARRTLNEGYYNNKTGSRRPRRSRGRLKESIKQCPYTAVIGEIKKASPSAGELRGELDVRETAVAFAANGVVGVSVLTEPKHFNGSLWALEEVRRAVNVPVLMKDIVLSPVQLDAAKIRGADTVLLIKGVYDRGYGEFSLEEMVEKAHGRDLEVLLEAHTLDEFRAAMGTGADLIGINNRDLSSMRVDLGTTERILRYAGDYDKMVVSMSGVESPEDVRYLKRCGADAFLVGSAIMRSRDMGGFVRRLVHC